MNWRPGDRGSEPKKITCKLTITGLVVFQDMRLPSRAILDFKNLPKGGSWMVPTIPALCAATPEPFLFQP